MRSSVKIQRDSARCRRAVDDRNIYDFGAGRIVWRDDTRYTRCEIWNFRYVCPIRRIGVRFRGKVDVASRRLCLIEMTENACRGVVIVADNLADRNCRSSRFRGKVIVAPTIQFAPVAEIKLIINNKRIDTKEKQILIIKEIF